MPFFFTLVKKEGRLWAGGNVLKLIDNFVEQVFASNGGLAFSLTVTGISGISDMVASAEIVTDSGAQAAADATEITALTAFHLLEFEMGFAELK